MNAATTGSVADHESSAPGRVRHAGRVVTIGGALGLLGQLLFFDVGLGVNLVIGIVLLLVGGWLARRPEVRPSLADAWLAPAAVLFAAFAALRADTTLVTLDLLAALALSGAALATFGGRDVVSRPMASVLRASFAVVGWAGGGGVAALRDARRQLPGAERTRERVRPALPMLRGLLLAAPILVVLVTLFSSADPIFARTVEELVGIDLELGDATGRLVLAAALGWIATGLLALSASRAPDPMSASRSPAPAWGLGTTEALTVVLLVNAVFAGFVGLQAAYLFGGLDTLQAVGLSYAEYARRGFFELVAAAMLAIGLTVALDRLARRRTAWLIGAGVGLMSLTAVVLASSVLRMRLYQEAYGWTELRLYVLAVIVLLAVVLVAMIASLPLNRVRWIGHVAVIAGLVIGVGLNVIGPVRFITEQNVARLAEPSLVPEHRTAGLDELYLTSLGDDAVPGLVRAMALLDADRATYLRMDLGFRLRELRAPGLEAWQAWNLGREAARDALDAELRSP